MKAQELKEKTTEELNDLLQENLREQFALRMQRGTGQLAQTHLIKDVRRNIARIKTIISEKQGN